jgi:acyl carrier protein
MDVNHQVVGPMTAHGLSDAKAKIDSLIEQHAGLPRGSAKPGEDEDLYRAGMKSFASVQLMLALEETFDIEFPDDMLTRATFRSRAAIEQAVLALLSPARPVS